MQEREDSKLVIDLRKTLKLDNYRPEDLLEVLRDYQIILKAAFDSDRHRQKANLSEFLRGPYGEYWESKGSLLLVLHGRNEGGKNAVTHSWLSPIATDLLENLLGSGRTVAFDICSESSTIEVVMSRLIYQLLERNPAVIRLGVSLQQIESQLSREGDKSDRVAALRGALSQIINLHNDPVFIVLDRPDRNDEESQAEYIETMFSLVKEAKTDLKVMVIQRSEIWDVEKRKHEIRIPEVDSRVFRTARMDQRRL